MNVSSKGPALLSRQDKNTVLFQTLSIAAMLLGVTMTESDILRGIFSVGIVLGFYNLIRLWDPIIQKYRTSLSRPGYYTGTRRMWVAEMLTQATTYYIYKQGRKRNLNWDAARMTAMAEAAGEMVLKQQMAKAMTEQSPEIMEALHRAFEDMVKAAGDTMTETGKGMGEAMNEHASKIRFNTRVRNERNKGLSAIRAHANRIRREEGLPLRTGPLG